MGSLSMDRIYSESCGWVFLVYKTTDVYYEDMT